MRMSDFVKELHESGVEYKIEDSFLVISSPWEVKSQGKVAIFGRFTVLTFNNDTPIFVSGKNLIVLQAPITVKGYVYKNRRTGNFINKNKMYKNRDDNSQTTITTNKSTKNNTNNRSEPNSGNVAGEPKEGESDNNQ